VSNGTAAARCLAVPGRSGSALLAKRLKI